MLPIDELCSIVIQRQHRGSWIGSSTKNIRGHIGVSCRAYQGPESARRILVIVWIAL